MKTSRHLQRILLITACLLTASCMYRPPVYRSASGGGGYDGAYYPEPVGGFAVGYHRPAPGYREIHRDPPHRPDIDHRDSQRPPPGIVQARHDRDDDDRDRHKAQHSRDDSRTHKSDASDHRDPPSRAHSSRDNDGPSRSGSSGSRGGRDDDDHSHKSKDDDDDRKGGSKR